MTIVDKNTTLYSKIIEQIKNNIRQGVYGPNEKIPTEAELAEQFNVSRITSKKALDDLAREGVIIRKRRSGSFVNPDAVDLLKKGSMKKAGTDNVYVQGINNLIGVVLPIETSQGDLIHCIRGILDEVTKKGYYLSIHNSERNPENERKIIEKLVSDGVRGIIYYPFSDRFNYGAVGRLSMNDYPILTIDKYYEGLPMSHVVFDNLNGSYAMTQYILNKGHKRIAFVSPTSIDNESSVRNRYIGYCKALRDNGVEVDGNLVIDKVNVEDEKSNYSPEYFKPVLRCLLNNGATAIQAVSDGIAMLMIEACKDMGIKVPEELSITGFDDLSDSGKTGVGLTTMRLNLDEMGKLAANRIISQIEGKSKNFHKDIIPVTLVERESVKEIQE